MSLPVKILSCITTLEGAQQRHPGGHNWPDLELVLDPSQTSIEDDEIYLVQIQQREPVVKRCRKLGETELWLHPAVATVHNSGSTMLFGKKMPMETVEFSDNIYLRNLTIHGKVVGLWAGAA